MKPKIQIIIGSTRPKRKSEMVAAWLYSLSKSRGEAEFEILDLRDFPMPHYNEPTSAKMVKEYIDPVVDKWNKKIAEGDGYIIISPEYNHGYPGVLKDALDFPYANWNNKPVGFVSYGSVGGARVVEQLRLVSIELQMVPIEEAINIFHIGNVFNKNGEMIDEHYNKKANDFFDLLIWFSKILKVAREKPKTFEDIGDTE